MRWLVDVARGLGAAHARGLFHRDMKPANVMVSRDNVAKVVDFGLAKKETMTPELKATFQTATGFVIGTPAYMAPEQLEGLTVDARTDQFGWALTAYALMLGKNLRTNDPLLFGPIPLLCDRVPGISRRTSEIVLRALSNDREMRFPSMEALLSELEPALDQTVSVQPNATAILSPKSSTEPPTQQATPMMPQMPIGASPKFCSDCGIPLGMSSPGCTGPHAPAFPKPGD
jgi:serine/threonine protein kinase